MNWQFKKIFNGLVVLPVFFIASIAVAAPQYAIVGKAYSAAQPQQLLYTESYTAMDSRKHVAVDYVSPEGELIAEKVLDFSSGMLTPGFTLTDHRFNSRDSAQVKGKRIILQRRKNATSDPEKKTIDQKPVQVIDAGFARLVGQYWSALLAGERQVFYFAFAARLKNIKLEMSRVAGQDTPIYDDKRLLQYFKMEIDNGFLAMFIDPIYLAFDKQKRLVRYYGRSNLTNAKGENQDVLIKYQYIAE